MTSLAASRDTSTSWDLAVTTGLIRIGAGIALLLADPRYESQREGLEKAMKAHADFLRGTDPEGNDKKVRIDLFGVKEGGGIDGKLTVLRPELPKLKAGQSYLVDVVVRTRPGECAGLSGIVRCDEGLASGGDFRPEST